MSIMARSSPNLWQQTEVLYGKFVNQALDELRDQTK
jgi:hypothetical protein